MVLIFLEQLEEAAQEGRPRRLLEQRGSRYAEVKPALG